MNAAIYQTESVYAGDTWPGIPSISILVNGAVPSAPVTAAKLIFFKDEEGPANPALTLASPDSIGIVDAANWAITIPPVILNLPKGEWTFRFSTDAGDEASTVRTWLVGTITII